MLVTIMSDAQTVPQTDMVGHKFHVGPEKKILFEYIFMKALTSFQTKTVGMH